MGENQLLKGVNLVLKGHKISNCLISSGMSARAFALEAEEIYPSFGSLIDLRLMYSSYSKRPGFSINQKTEV